MALRADINGDCRVDFYDFVILAEEWLMESEDCMANKYLTFDGSTGFITVPNDAALNLGTGNFSISFWLKKEYSGKNETIFRKYLQGGAKGYAFTATGGGYLSYLFIASGELMSVEIGSVTIGEWMSVIVTCDRSGYIIAYVDGVAGSPQLTSYFSGIDLDNTADATFGCAYIETIPLYGDFFTGSLDDFRVYKKALSEAEVLAIYNGGKGKKYDIADAGAGLAFNFDEGTGNPVSSGTAELTGTITGGVTWEDGGVPFIEEETEETELRRGSFADSGNEEDVSHINYGLLDEMSDAYSQYISQL
jgi:hypothetical protein